MTATTWTPLLDGLLAERVRTRVDGIASSLLKAPPPDGDFDHSIGSGSAGLAVVHAALARATGDPAHGQRSADHLAHARRTVATRRTPRGLYGGFTGVAWAVQHLQPTTGSDPLATVDTTLARVLEQSPWRGHFDLISGLAGIGMYGLERRSRGTALCELAVDRLAELAVPREVGATWHTSALMMLPATAAIHPGGWDDLGLAHGSPGVVAFLAGCCAADVAVARAAPLVEQAVAWILSERLDVPGGRFPSCRIPDFTPSPARAAWCYGDPGVAAVLLLAGQAMGRTDWSEIAVQLATDAAERSIEDAGVVDATLCHGAAGLAHVYARMHHASGDPALADAARTWYRRVFEVPAFIDDDGARDDGILRGAGGVALALLAGLEPDEPTWDPLLALSAPAGPPAMTDQTRR